MRPREIEGREPQSSGKRLLTMKQACEADMQGYIKPIGTDADYVMRFFPEIRFARGRQLFALYSADGTPLMISATLDAAFDNARVYRMAGVTLH